MKKPIIILSTFMFFINSISNLVNYKINNIEEKNKIITKQNMKLKNENNFDLNIKDFISAENTNFKNSGVEFWFVLFKNVKKKLCIGYEAWTNYFQPMIQKLDQYIIKNKVSPRTAGEIKIGLINMFAKVIKHNFFRGGNDTDRNYPFWDGYQIAASYIINNKEYLNIYFRSNGVDSVFETCYWNNNCFLDEEQLEALDIDSENKDFISDIERFTLPSDFLF